MSVALAPSPVFQGLGFGGLPLPGGKLFTYIAGTSTPQATYVDSTQTTPNANPVILNANGQANVWLVQGQTYKLVLQDAFGNQVWSVDQIPGGAFASPIGTNIIPSVTNTYNVGSPSFTWANGYFGTQIYVGGSPIVQLQTAAELTAGVTPTNLSYPPGHPWRYGAVDDGATNNNTALQNWIKVGQQGVPLSFPAVLCGGGYLITTAPSITAPLAIFGGGWPRSALLCNGCDGFTIAAGVAQIFISDIRINQLVRYQAANGTVTVNAFAGIRMLGTAISACSNHYYHNIFCDGFQSGFVANGAAFVVFDCCNAIFGFNGIIAATFPVNVTVRNGIYQCGNLTNAGVLTGSVGVQFGDGATAAQGCNICDGCVITGFATNVWLFGANFCKVLDSYLDFTNGVGVLAQSNTNASTSHDIRNNYIAMTALGTTGIRLLSSTASSNVPDLGSRVVDNVIIMYASGASRGILIDGTFEANNLIAGNVINAGSTADLQINTGLGHVVVDNHFQGQSFLSSVFVTYDNNFGTPNSNPNTCILPSLYSVIQNGALAYSASITPDLRTGNSQVITATNGSAFTINSPTNPQTSGAIRLSIWIANTSGGVLGAVTWNVAFKVPAGITYPATGFRRCYQFEQTSGGLYYLMVSPTVDIPN